jgi:WhiB family transcriptional regulator, redox-sensing transcriptional regulator
MSKTAPAEPNARPRRTTPAAMGAPAGDWWELAACRAADPEVFFPVPGSGAAALVDLARAKAICRSCTVCEPCLNFALDTRQAHGVWGGRSEEERRPIAAARCEARQRT